MASEILSGLCTLLTFALVDNRINWMTIHAGAIVFKIKIHNLCGTACRSHDWRPYSQHFFEANLTVIDSFKILSIF